MRLIVPYLLVLLQVSAVVLSTSSPLFAAFATLQILGWIIAFTSLHYRIPVLNRIAAPASALLVLNAAAVVGFYKFLFTRGPLWKIWNSGAPKAKGSTLETANLPPPGAVVSGGVIEIGKGSCTD
jgi:hypothetical protein